MGYSYVLLAIAFFRELLGAGTIFDIRVLGDWWTNWNIMIMAPGAFFTLAIFIWIIKTIIARKEEAQAKGKAPAK
jgi:Na+-transporting NADH:ubiquinone oxidoreductase subunit D